ncbi:MAG TPA: hypothetical protein VIT62_02295 [Lysobacter sp.]
MRLAMLTCAVSVALMFTADAAAQMRAGQPQVLTPTPRSAPQAVSPWSALRGRLGTRNRVMLLWDAELDSEVNTRYREVETLDRRVQGAAAQVDGVVDSAAGPVGVAVAGGSAQLQQRTEKFVEGAAPSRTSLSAGERAMQSEFMEQLRQGGVRFIDRTLATRLAGKSVQGDRPNVHAIETQALIGHADYLMEVTSVADAQVQSGRRYHVSLRAVANGEILVDFDTAADVADAGPLPYVAAGAGGFERAEPPAPTSADTARVLARETGRRMVDMQVRR